MLFRSHNPRPSSTARRVRPYLEILEDRTVPSVLTPAQVRHAYGFDQIVFNLNGQNIAGDGRGQTIAIVDAYNDPNILSDLQHFDQTFGLPNPVFTKATPEGLPPTDAGWSMEIALDVEWAHAIAPGAKILLVEAHSNSLSDLLGAVDYARQQTGVVAVSMSWGAGEFSGENFYDSYFTTPGGHLGGSSGLAGAGNLPGGVTFVASSGDNGAQYGPEWPAVSSNVLSVGGTHLNLADSSGTYGSETGWSGSGGGYSQFYNRPTYQNGFNSNSHRGNPDVAYNADPNSGFYVYDTVPYNGGSGWWSVGGTSAGAPQWAALIAIADQGRALQGTGSLDGPSQTLYGLYQLARNSYATYFHDIVSGNNGFNAHTGYDAVTGLGTPKAAQIVAGLVAITGSGSSISTGSGSGTGSSGGSGGKGSGLFVIQKFELEWGNNLYFATLVTPAYSTTYSTLSPSSAPYESTGAPATPSPMIPTGPVSSHATGRSQQDASDDLLPMMPRWLDEDGDGDDKFPLWPDSALKSTAAAQSEWTPLLRWVAEIAATAKGMPVIMLISPVKSTASATPAFSWALVEVPKPVEQTVETKTLPVASRDYRPAAVAGAVAVAAGLSLMKGRNEKEEEASQTYNYVTR